MTSGFVLVPKSRTTGMRDFRVGSSPGTTGKATRSKYPNGIAAAAARRSVAKACQAVCLLQTGTDARGEARAFLPSAHRRKLSLCDLGCL